MLLKFLQNIATLGVKLKLSLLACIAITLGIGHFNVRNAVASGIPAVDLPSLVSKILPGVVNISSVSISNDYIIGLDEYFRYWGIPRERKQPALGSGFLIDSKEGMIITNDHVVDRSSEVIVTLLDKRQFTAMVLGKDKKLDIALLRIYDKNEKIPGGLTAVPMGDSEGVRIAESVFAVGNPFGLQHTVTLGIISAKNRTIGQGPFDGFLQTDASINPGNSGGPLFNLRGEVIGINTMIYSQTGQSIGLGFATPINDAKAILSDLKLYRRVLRPWLGIQAERMTSQIQKYYGLGVSKGVLIYSVYEDTPADSYGLKEGDIIISVDKMSVMEPNDLEKILSKRKSGETLIMKIQRGPRAMELKIRLQDLPDRVSLPRGVL